MYATYAVVYIATALGWLYVVDGVTPMWNDDVGVALALARAGAGAGAGAGVIAMGRRPV